MKISHPEEERLVTNWGLKAAEKELCVIESLSDTLRNLSAVCGSSNSTTQLISHLPDRIFIRDGTENDVFIFSVHKFGEYYSVHYMKKNNSHSSLLLYKDSNIDVALSKMKAKLEDLEERKFLKIENGSGTIDLKAYKKAGYEDPRSTIHL